MTHPDAPRDEAATPSTSEALSRAMAEARARLRSRRVWLGGEETSGELARLLEAVERFEQAVEQRGGDLFLDSGDAPEPDDPTFVLPRRRDDESVSAYVARVDAAREAVLRRPPIA